MSSENPFFAKVENRFSEVFLVKNLEIYFFSIFYHEKH